MSALMHSPGLGLPALSEPNLKKKNEKPSTFSALDPAKVAGQVMTGAIYFSYYCRSYWQTLGK